MRESSWADSVEDVDASDSGGSADCGRAAAGGGSGRTLEATRWTMAQKKVAKEQAVRERTARELTARGTSVDIVTPEDQLRPTQDPGRL
jgi:hypothetical protein